MTPNNPSFRQKTMSLSSFLSTVGLSWTKKFVCKLTWMSPKDSVSNNFLYAFVFSLKYIKKKPQTHCLTANMLVVHLHLHVAILLTHFNSDEFIQVWLKMWSNPL